MLTEGNLKHMLAVGKLMAKYWDIFGHDKDGGGLGADGLFMLGYLHDIGCYKDIEEPDKAGAEIIMHTFPWALNPGHLGEDDFIEPECDYTRHSWFGRQVPEFIPKSKCEIYKGSMIAHCIRWHKTSPDVYMAFFNVTEDEIPSALCLLWWADMCVGDRDDKTVVRSNTDDTVIIKGNAGELVGPHVHLQDIEDRFGIKSAEYSHARGIVDWLQTSDRGLKAQQAISDKDTKNPDDCSESFLD